MEQGRLVARGTLDGLLTSSEAMRLLWTEAQRSGEARALD